MTFSEVPKVRSPWRRFFARNLDLIVYSLLWVSFMSVVMNVNVTTRGQNLLTSIMGILLMFLIEPVMLTCFGTTLGKWIFGLSVTDNDYRRLSYPDALARTWTVAWHGMGLNIPIYGLVRQWNSYIACDKGEALEWEDESLITLQDKKLWRVGAFICASAVLVSAQFLALTVAGMPKHRGDITVSQFCENYNRLLNYYKPGTGRYLDKAGQWVKDENLGRIVGFHDYLVLEDPEFIFTEDAGIMTGMRFTTELCNSDEWVHSYQNHMVLATVSFVGAQKGYSLFSRDMQALTKEISATASTFENFQFTARGISITCSAEYSGYINTQAGLLLPEEGSETFFSFDFTMVKE